jgi:hypothetical protein
MEEICKIVSPSVMVHGLSSTEFVSDVMARLMGKLVSETYWSNKNCLHCHIWLVVYISLCLRCTVT